MENLYTENCIRTVSGRYVNILKPEPETLIIEDIAHALSNIPRFGGHLPRFYSVAQHCCMCYLMAAPKEAYNALMHDASEAYLLDIPKPLKLHMPDYNAIEHNFMMVLSAKFGFAYPLTPEVKRTDKLMLEWEWTFIMLGKAKDVKCLTSKQAAQAFLKAYNSCKTIKK